MFWAVAIAATHHHRTLLTTTPTLTWYHARSGAGILHSSLQRQMEELTAAGVLHEADFNERVLDALHCLPLANAQVCSAGRVLTARAPRMVEPDVSRVCVVHAVLHGMCWSSLVRVPPSRPEMGGQRVSLRARSTHSNMRSSARGFSLVV